MRSPLFKITASLVKPTRETLLDYCSYCLVVIGLIGVARVWVGGAGLQNTCTLEEGFGLPGEEFPRLDDFELPSIGHETTERVSTAIPRPTKEVNTNGEATFLVEGHNDLYQPVSSTLDTSDDERQVALRRKIKGKSLHLPEDSAIQRGGSVNSIKPKHEKCAKEYQSVFAYILLIESAILLFLGLLWAKIPKVSCVIKEFIKLIHSCEKSEWAKRALHLINQKGQAEDMSQSLYSVISNDSAVYGIKSLLDTIFHPDGDYRTKACARHLYEKVQIFCDVHSRRTAIWTTYFIKSFLQFGLWIIVFNINLVLFVVLEFYIMCPEDSPIPCDHDRFLRIMWFMAQTVLLIYVVFICKTLRWINEKAIVHRWSCCNYFNSIRKHRTVYTSDDSSSLSCRPYRFADNKPVYNDVALLLHLLEESHPKILPYFVVFMFPEWNEKLTSFANPIEISDMPIQTAMQMLSGRPPPIIEITDIQINKTEEQVEYEVTRSTLPKKKPKNAVSFYIGNDFRNKVQHLKKSLSEEVITNATCPLQATNLSISNSPRPRKKSQSSPTPSWKNRSKRHINIGLESNLMDAAAAEDTAETTALVHKSSSSDSLKSSDRDSNTTGAESHQSSDMSESRSLLRNN